MSFSRNLILRKFLSTYKPRNYMAYTKTKINQRSWTEQFKQSLEENGKFFVFAIGSGIAGVSVAYLAWSNGYTEVFQPGNTLLSKPEKRKLTAREKRFMKFASVEYNGQIYMTPQDFLESVVEGEPRPRLKRKRLSDREVSDIQSRLPRLNKNDEHFFRALGNHGIISFSEYLFLLTILIKPQTGFKIAFAMLDQDGNERIDRGEFKLLERVFSTAARDRKMLTDGQQEDEQHQQGQQQQQQQQQNELMKKEFDDDEHGLLRAHDVDTTLLIYFFGKKGSDQLKFEDFHKFMENLQTEVLEMEFQEFSKGARIITEMDFARILLRYTFLNSEEYDGILDRLLDRLHDEELKISNELNGISFNEFKDFCLFLNNLDDFQIAMRMYTLADKAISEDEFSRAVHICTGRSLSPYLVHTVFQIFDNDGDGLLSYQEFIAMMKDRVNRGLKTFSRQEGWTGFKKCVKQEVRSSN